MDNIKSKAWKCYFRKPLQFSAGKVLVDQNIIADGDALSCDGRFNGMELFLETQAHCVCKARYIVVSYLLPLFPAVARSGLPRPLVTIRLQCGENLQALPVAEIWDDRQ